MNQRIGYARVSTDDRLLDLQRDALQQVGCSVIYEEAASGKSAARPELEQCRNALRAVDTLVVWRLDRLGCSLPDLVQIVNDLEQRGVGFESLTEKIETGSAAGKLIRERTQARVIAHECEAALVDANRRWLHDKLRRLSAWCLTQPLLSVISRSDIGSHRQLFIK